MLPALLTSSFHVASGSKYIRVAQADTNGKLWAAWTKMLDRLPKCTPKGPWIVGREVRTFLNSTMWPVEARVLEYIVPDPQSGQILRSRLEMMDGCYPIENAHGPTTHHDYRLVLTEAQYLIRVHSLKFPKSLDEGLAENPYTVAQVGWDGVGFRISIEAHRDLQNKVLRMEEYTITKENRVSLWHQILGFVDEGFKPTITMLEAFTIPLDPEDEPVGE